MSPQIAQTSRPRALRPRALISTLAIGTFAFAVACGGPENSLDGEAQQELVGGTATSLRPEVGLFRGCTATLIHERYVLTAAHCLGFPNYTDTTVLPGDSFTVGNISYDVDKIHSFAYGRYDYTQSGDRVTDVLLVRLVVAVPASVATPVPVAERMPRNGERVTTFGIGCDIRWPGTGGGIKRYFEFDYGDSTQALCPGDSGGPVFLGDRYDGGALWGINADYFGTEGWGDWDDIFGDVTGLKVQIEAVIRQWEGGDGLEPGFDRTGGDYHTFLVSSNDVEACRTACNSDSRCLAFSFRAPWIAGPQGECRLKDQMSGMRPRTGYTSGTSSSRIVETNTDRPGGGYRSFGTRSSFGCRRACAEEARCAAFTHHNNRCWLKSEEGTPQRLTGAISGRKGGLEMNTDRAGSGYRSFTPSTQDPEHCQSTCSRDRACRSWTYTPPSGSSDARCWLKDAVPNPYSTIGMTSGYLSPYENIPAWFDDEPNTDRFGGDYRTMSSLSAANCKSACQSESICRAWTWVPPRNGTGAWCALKDAVPAARNTTNMVSGRKGFEYHPEPTF